MISPTDVALVVQRSPPVLPGFTARTPRHFAEVTYYLFTGDSQDGAFLVHEGVGLEVLRTRFPNYSAWPARAHPRQVLWHLVPTWKSFGHTKKVVPHLISDPGICKASGFDEWSGCVSGYVGSGETPAERRQWRVTSGGSLAERHQRRDTGVRHSCATLAILVSILL